MKCFSYAYIGGWVDKL